MRSLPAVGDEALGQCSRDWSRAPSLALGVVGLVVCTAGAVATWNRGPEFGPHWYPLALVVLSLPCAWVGGKLAQ